MQQGDISNNVAPGVLVNVIGTLLYPVSNERTLLERVLVRLGSYTKEVDRYTLLYAGMNTLDKLFVTFDFRVILCTVGQPSAFSSLVQRNLEKQRVAFTEFIPFGDALMVRDFVLRKYNHITAYVDSDPGNLSVVGRRGVLFKSWSQVLNEL